MPRPHPMVPRPTSLIPCRHLQAPPHIQHIQLLCIYLRDGVLRRTFASGCAARAWALPRGASGHPQPVRLPAGSEMAVRKTLGLLSALGEKDQRPPPTTSQPWLLRQRVSTTAWILLTRRFGARVCGALPLASSPGTGAQTPSLHRARRRRAPCTPCTARGPPHPMPARTTQALKPAIRCRPW